MSGKARLLLLVIVMAGTALIAAGSSIWTLYRAALSEERARLVETAQSQARLIEAVARFDAVHSGAAHPDGAAAATLSQVVDAHEKYAGFGATGEFSLARREGDQMVFLLRHRLGGLDMPEPVPWNAERAEPMRRALKGESGTIIATDYRGTEVVAAYEPVAVLDLGIVVKIDLAEVRAPFIRAGAASALGGLAIVLLGGLLIRQISVPFLQSEAAERAARESETRFRDFAEGASDWMWEMDSGLRFTSLSPDPTTTQASDRPYCKSARRPCAADFARWEALKSQLATRQEFRDFEQKWIGPDGEQRFIRISGKPVFGPDGAFLGYRGTGSDVTAVVEAVARKAEAEQRFARAMDVSPAVFALYDASDRLVIGNKLFRSMYETPRLPIVPGVGFEELVRAFAAHVGIGGSRVEAELWLAKRLDRRRAPAGSFDYQRGDREWIEVSDFVLDDGSVFTIGTIITQRKQMEEQLHQAQKMDAIGQLTGGVAHDFNNLLAVILGNLELARDQLGDSDPLLESLRPALKAARRGADLTRHLLAFSRTQPLRPKALDLNELVSGVGRLLRRTLGERIKIDIHSGDAPIGCVADPVQLENALLNIALNARDAMPDGGRLTIKTANVCVDEDDQGDTSEIPPGPYVMLAVADDGAGMAGDVKDRVFEPFFTTKEVGEGSGLGLSMVHGFAKQSGGQVVIDSEVGRGTEVRLYLPASDLSPCAPDAAPTEVLRRGCGETILVVEDDPDVRSLAVKVLGKLGYRVLEAEEGESAIAVLVNGAAVDLLLTDVVLSGAMSGPELSEKARRRRGGLKVLFMSGYAPESLASKIGLQQSAALLGKPFSREDLARRVRESLDAG